MNKTLALIAALGLVVSAPAFAADEGTTTNPDTKASAEAPAKPETKATTKEKVASKSKEKGSKEEATKTDAKAPKAAELAPAAGGSKFDKSEKTGEQN